MIELAWPVVAMSFLGVGAWFANRLIQSSALTRDLIAQANRTERAGEVNKIGIQGIYERLKEAEESISELRKRSEQTELRKLRVGG